jgi:hypothetical protein
VSVFHLHARLVEGPLGAFTRDESRAATADSWPAAVASAERLRESGFTVWIYEHGTPSPIPTASDLHVVARLSPGSD